MNFDFFFLSFFFLKMPGLLKKTSMVKMLGGGGGRNNSIHRAVLDRRSAKTLSRAWHNDQDEKVPLQYA